MLAVMSRNRDIITNDLGTLVFYMQGSISFNDSWLLSAQQRKILGKVVEKHYSEMSGKGNNKLF
jgi:hypothetical protein